MHPGALINVLNKTLYHFNGVAPIITGTSNPIILNKKYKQSGMDPKKRKELVNQEAANQIVTMVVHVLMYYGLSIASKKLIMKKLPAIKEKMAKHLGEEGLKKLKHHTEGIRKIIWPDKEIKEFEIDDLITEQMADFAKIIIANLGGLLGFGIVRPLLGATLFKHMMKKENGDIDGIKNTTNQQALFNTGIPLRRIGDPKTGHPAYSLREFG